MKKIIIAIPVLILLINPQPVSAATWLNCPFNKINDPYPGLCARYIDTDQDSICDNSQADSANRVIKTTSQTKNPITNDYHLIRITVVLLLFYGLSKYLVYLRHQNQNKFLPLFKVANVRWTMNYLLLASFLLSFITALLSLAQIKLNWFVDSKINFSWWHVEFGYIMAVIAIIHIIERWRYFIKK